jgi:hypothetical protein
VYVRAKKSANERVMLQKCGRVLVRPPDNRLVGDNNTVLGRPLAFFGLTKWQCICFPAWRPGLERPGCWEKAPLGLRTMPDYVCMAT